MSSLSSSTQQPTNFSPASGLPTGKFTKRNWTPLNTAVVHPSELKSPPAARPVRSHTKVRFSVSKTKVVSRPSTPTSAASQPANANITAIKREEQQQQEQPRRTTGLKCTSPIPRSSDVLPRRSAAGITKKVRRRPPPIQIPTARLLEERIRSAAAKYDFEEWCQWLGDHGLAVYGGFVVEG